MAKLSSITEIDGIYNITYQSQAPNIPNIYWADHTIASATIANGKLQGQDVGGTTWTADLTLSENNLVNFLARVSTHTATSDTYLMTAHGQPTRETQAYSGALKVLILDEEITIHGTINHGVVTITINMKKI